MDEEDYLALDFIELSEMISDALGGNVPACIDDKIDSIYQSVKAWEQILKDGGDHTTSA